MGAADANLIWWVNTKAFTGLLLHLSSYRIRHLPFWLLKYDFLLTALLPATK
jgi:hypothetical protein